MKKIVDAFLILTAALAIPATIAIFNSDYFNRNKSSILTLTLFIAALFITLGNVGIKRNSTVLFWIKHVLLSAKSITTVLFVLLLLLLIDCIAIALFAWPFHQEPIEAILFMLTIAVTYILFLLITKKVPFGSAHNIYVHYNGRSPELLDFDAQNGRIYNNATQREEGLTSSANLTIENQQININRTNTDGRFTLTVTRYNFSGSTLPYIPINPIISGKRVFVVSFEASSKQGVKHTLLFAIKDADSTSWLQRHSVEIVSTEWQSIEFTLFVPSDKKLVFRVDDRDVGAAPSTLQIKNLRLLEQF
jgi:hypothetical protein